MSKIINDNSLDKNFEEETETDEIILDYFEQNSKYHKLNNIIKTQIINIDKYKFYIEYYQNGINFKDNTINNYTILRNFEIYNDIIYDKDIFLIDKSIYNQIKDDETTDKVCFPIIKNNIPFFTNSSSLYNNYGLSDLKDISYDIYNKNGELANIKCDKIRIYNPIIKKDLDYIIHIDNYINDIHFHYYCNLNSNWNG